MASTDDNNTMPPLPTLPPLVKIDIKFMEIWCRNFVLAKICHRQPPQHVQQIQHRHKRLTCNFPINQAQCLCWLSPTHPLHRLTIASIKELTPLLLILMTASHCQKKRSLTFQIAKVTMTRLHLVTILKAGWTKRKGGPRFMRSSNCWWTVG